MSKVVKRINDSNYDEVLNLSEYAFKYTLTEQQRAEQKIEMEKQTIFGIFENDQLSAKLHLLPLELFLGKDVVPFGGVAAVATWPEHRRKGHVEALIKAGLEEMRDRNQTLSMLAPFSISFYRKFGWELTHYVHKYYFNPVDIAKVNVDGRCVRVSFEHANDVLQSLYEQMAQKYSLVMKREFWWWEKRVLSTDDHVIIYYDRMGKATGYLTSKVKNGVLQVNEFVFLTGDACKGLLEWIRNHDSMTDQVELNVQPQDDIVFYFHNPKIKMCRESYFMTRIVDFERFILSYPFFRTDKPFKVSILLQDDYAEWNSGGWTLFIQDNRVEKITKNMDPDSDLSITTNIQTLTALLFNSESVERLHTFDHLQIEGDIEVAKKLIQPLPPALLDFF
ncbi:GNAT family N-acetyltransferase [Aquibacillus albus]|uniref:Acetyltransferase n=1 Tax=Aquibacillus albus TaxID=1168171 RepID=A0ABS2N2C3_9BACI|nr:GNAT family N-acetyltransferase [Aquibacillus albus]MBM7572253.1 putative acetyltransferase [Aquibacillus albus]